MPLAPRAFTAPLGLHRDLHLSTFSVRTGDRLLFFTDGLLEARDRAGRFFRVDQQIPALSRPDLQAAADEVLDRLRAHTRRRLDDDVAVLLAELTLTDPGSALQPAAPGQRPGGRRDNAGRITCSPGCLPGPERRHRIPRLTSPIRSHVAMPGRPIGPAWPRRGPPA